MKRQLSKCTKDGCDNFGSGDDGQCNACRRGPMTEEKRKAEREAAKERAVQRKRQKVESRTPCVKCGGKQMLSMSGRTTGASSYTLPNGDEDDSCDMPHFPAFTRSEGMELTVCVDCGTIVGFDSDALKAAIAEAERNLRERWGEA